MLSVQSLRTRTRRKQSRPCVRLRKSEAEEQPKQRETAPAGLVPCHAAHKNVVVITVSLQGCTSTCFLQVDLPWPNNLAAAQA